MWETPCSSPFLSSMPTTMVSVVPSGTMPDTGLAQGPLPCWISIQQSTLSPRKLSSTTSRSETLMGGLVTPFS